MKLKSLILAVILVLSVNVFADEGMWQLSQIPSLKLHKKGLKMDVEDLDSFFQKW